MLRHGSTILVYTLKPIIVIIKVLIKEVVHLRKLVSIQLIRDIQPIPDAEAIEVAKILGWSVVIKKGEFKVGDKVVYAEIDSVLPDRPEFDFLRERKFRIKTVRLRGQISQGICFPLSVLPEGEYEVEQDVTDVLGVIKYEPPIPACLEGEVKGMFPSFMPKTDETRIQILQNELTQLKGHKCSYSEKLEGTSTTFYLKDGEFGVCTRSLDLVEDDRNTLWQMARKYGIEEKLRKLNRNLAFQGETIGESIQKNYYQLARNERRFYLFNIFDIDKYEYLEYDEFMKVAKDLEIETVPILEENLILTDNIDELVQLSIGYSVINPKVRREGIVIKLKNNPSSSQQISFKSINPEFLLHFKD